MTQIGLMLEGQFGLNWDRWGRILKTAEDSGYDSVFRSDHFSIGKDDDSLELWMSLMYAATHTQRIEFGPLVSPVTFRHPSMTVRYATAVDDISNGRLVLGLGAGWHEDEHIQWGVPFYDFPTRYAMFEEALELTQRVLHADEPVSFAGEHFSLKDAILLPRPQRAGGPPILIGGNGPKRTLPLVAKYAKEWNAVFIDRDTYTERRDILNGYLEQEGRQPRDVKRSLMTRVIYGRTDAEVKARMADTPQPIGDLEAKGYIVGTPQQIVDQIGKWTEAGVERFMLQWLELDDTDGIENMAADILPHFHNA